MIKVKLLGIAMSMLLTMPAFSQTNGARPNIIMIVSDEHNASVMGCAGNPVIHTPNLDKLASGGILFTGNYCSSPICVPSRQSMLLGKYVSHHNVWGNTVGAANSTISLPRILINNGYEAYLTGGFHLGGMDYGLKVYTASKKVVPPKNKLKTQKEMTPRPRKRIEAGIFKDNGAKIGKEFRPMGAAEETSENYRDIERRADAIAFLKDRKSNDSPFFLIVGFNAPHYPLQAPGSYLDKYRDKVPMPYLPPGYTDNLPLNYRHLRNERALEHVPADTVKLARESYYARVEWIDKQIGAVLQALKESPFSENTVVIYTSDHGENLGEHGLWWKNTAYDCSVRVPLIFNWPQRWKGGQVRDGACGSVDLVQTIAALGGATTPEDWDGNSMLPWLDHAAYKWKDMAISQFYAGYISSGITMIRQGQWKYVYHSRADESHGPEIELFDLKADRAELKNLAADPRYKSKIASLHKLLVSQLGEDPEQTETRWRNGATPEFPDGIKQQ